LRRFAGIHAGRCALVHPSGPPRPAARDEAEATEEEGRGEGGRAAASLRALVRRLDARGFAPLLLDLTRPALGVPAVRVLCPGLEVEPSARCGDRLRAAREETGGGDGQTGGIALM
jgi:ribosomal protein S12 methylthiotransferase accessory factor